MPDTVQEGTLFFCSSHVSVFSPSLEMQSIVKALAMPRGPRLPAKACPHALPRALPVRAHEQAVQELESLDFLVSRICSCISVDDILPSCEL